MGAGAFIELRASDLGERGEKINVRGEGLDVGGGKVLGPTPEGYRAGAAEPGRAFLRAHAGVENFRASGGTVVVHENNEGVAGEAPGLELSEEAADVFVDVVEHAVEVGDGCGVGAVADFIAIERCVGGARGVGRVRGVGGQRDEKRLAGVFAGLDPTGGLGEKKIGAETFGFFEGAVVQERGVEIGITGDIAAGAWVTLADAATTVDVAFVVTARGGLISGLVTEVPFAKNAGGVAGFF